MTKAQIIYHTKMTKAQIIERLKQMLNPGGIEESYAKEEILKLIDDINKQINPFRQGDRVKYKNKNSKVFYVYQIYSPTSVSLGLADYPDTEQDYQTDIKDIEKA